MSRQFFTQMAVLTLSLLLGNLLVQSLYPQAVQAERSSRPIRDAHPTTAGADFAIAYVGPSRESQQIRLINPDGSNDRPLWQAPPNTTRQQGIGELGWRSDASELAFDSGHDWQRSMNIRDIYS
ncbi:MAG: hypothetical protein DCC55_32860, partial [Chloroflexi bacterium]